MAVKASGQTTIQEFFNQLSPAEKEQALQLKLGTQYGGGTIETFLRQASSNEISTIVNQPIGQIFQFLTDEDKLKLNSVIEWERADGTVPGGGGTVPGGTGIPPGGGTTPAPSGTGDDDVHIRTDIEDRIRDVLEQNQKLINDQLDEIERQRADIDAFIESGGTSLQYTVNPELTQRLEDEILNTLDYKPGPGIQRFFDDQQLKRLELIRKQLGQGGMTGTPGIEMLRELDEAQVLALGQLRQGDLNALTNLGTGVANYENQRFNQRLNERQFNLNEIFGREDRAFRGNELLGNLIANQGKLSVLSQPDTFGQDLGNALVTLGVPLINKFL